MYVEPGENLHVTDEMRRNALEGLSLEELIVQCDKLGITVRGSEESKNEIIDHLMWAHAKLLQALHTSQNPEEIKRLQEFAETGIVPQGLMYYFAFPRNAKPAFQSNVAPPATQELQTEFASDMQKAQEAIQMQMSQEPKTRDPRVEAKTYVLEHSIQGGSEDFHGTP